MSSASPSCMTESVSTVSSTPTSTNSTTAEPRSFATAETTAGLPRVTHARARRGVPRAPLEPGDALACLPGHLPQRGAGERPDDDDEASGHQRDEHPAGHVA